MNLKVMNLEVIGITGYKRSGKDTIGDYIVKKHNYIRLAFADPIKTLCKNVFTFTDEQLETDKKEDIDDFWGHSPRELLQKIGTELFRETLPKLCTNIDSNIWIKSLKYKMMRIYKENPQNNKFIITDVRFPNEEKFIRDMNGILIKVNRSNLCCTNNKHKSESYIEKIVADYNINNNGTINELYNKIDHIM
jgi:hypothetical protein